MAKPVKNSGGRPVAAPPADAAPERRANRRARREASIAVDEQSAAGHDIPTAAQLRSRATARLADRPKLVVLPADPDPQKLVHELQVHQTELEMQNEALRESRTLAEAASERLEIALRATGAGLWDWDLEAGTLHLSAHCHEILGLTRHRAQTDPGRLARLVHPDDLPAARHALERRLTADVEGDVEFRMRDAAGSLRWLQCTGRVTSRHPDGAPRRMVGTLTDITERKRAEEQLRIAGVAFRSGEAMIVTDAHGVILQVNPAFTEITGYSAEEAVGHTPALMKSGRHDTDFYRTLWEAVTREGHWEGEIWNRRKDGSVFAEWLSISGVRDASGRTTHYLGSFSDISDPRARERKIVELAFYDPLTALPNRRLFMDRLSQAAVASARSGEFGAVLLLNLDRFKILNDARGYTAGDELLNAVATRLRASLRETDSAARLGGDEFVVLLERLNRDALAAANIAEGIAEKLRSAISMPAVVGGKAHHITPSIGITLFHDPRDDAETLLRQADLALYQAKAAGRDTIRFFSPEMQAAVEARAEMEAGLRRALAEGELELHYQPKVELRRGVMVGAEALIRWNDRSGSLVRPDVFIPLAEETGLIVPIGEWVIETACQQMATWRRAGLPAPRIAVNVSPRQFQQENLAQVVAQALRLNDLEGEALELEVTESAVMGSPEETAAILHELKRLGVRISLDDFGTGYSSLGHLKRFPIDTLKIDRSFVRDITTDPEDAAIAAMIIALAHNLKRTVVAEGVETEAQLKFLQQRRCDEMQGYFFSRPLPAAQFTSLLREQRRLEPAAADEA